MAIQSKLYFRKWPSGDWNYQGLLTGTGEQSFNLSDFADWNEWEDWDDENHFWSGYKYEWRIDTYDTETGLTTTGDTWNFITPITRKWWHGRFYNFSPELFFQQSADDGAGDWVDAGDLDLYEMDAGRLKRNLIVVNSQGDIYYGEL